jgi:hypothetical protein
MARSHDAPIRHHDGATIGTVLSESAIRHQENQK